MDQTNPPLDLDDKDMPYTPASHPQQFGAHKKKGSKLPLWIGLGGVLVVVLSIGVYLLFFKASKPAAKNTAQATTQSPPKAASGLNQPQANATEKTFKSDKLGVEFTYRSDWTLKESSDKQLITLTSPRLAYTTKDGKATEGVFTVKLRHGVIPDATQQTVQKSVAVKDSLVIAYAHPTAQQRQYTNLSYGGPDAQTFTFFIVSGNTSYKTGQMFGAQLSLVGDAYMFVGGYGADTNDTLAFDQVSPAKIDTEGFQQAQKIIESLKIN